MPLPRPLRPSLHEPEGQLSERIRAPRWVVNAVAVALIALSMLGAYRGLISARRGDIGVSLLDAAALVQGQPIAASPAVSLPADPNWSTLKGPQVLTPPIKRAVVADDEPASDDAADMQDAAADSPEAQAAEAQTSPQTEADDAAPTTDEQRAPAQAAPPPEPRQPDPRGRAGPPTP